MLGAEQTLEKKRYGVVYTPNLLSEFVATLLLEEWLINTENEKQVRTITVLDPACGEGALLSAMHKVVTETCRKLAVQYIGTDLDEETIALNNGSFPKSAFHFHAMNAIIPDELEKPDNSWRKIAPNTTMVIANPPWSSEKQFDKKTLKKTGYTFFSGQQDTYALFIDVCLRIIQPGGYLAFILPDSIFSCENIGLRKHIVETTCIKVVARLGEKLFPGVNRAATVLVLQKVFPNEASITKCFRLDTKQRKDFLSGKSSLISTYRSCFHSVLQNRFAKNTNYLFDVDAKHNEEALLDKIESNSICWKNEFRFGRGVEIGKTGAVVICPNCRNAQGFSKNQMNKGEKNA